MPRRQIMLVDDEPRLLAALKRRLSSEFEILTFERGRDALAYLSGVHDVAVVVADMQMPEMNGVEFLSGVYNHDPDIRRIMLTGNSDQETATAAINEARVLRFIRKPCDAMLLKDILLEALEEFEFKKTDLNQLATVNAIDATGAQAQKTFLSVMSDELRTPLSQIITISGILARNGKSTETKVLEVFLKQIHESGKLALEHVDRVLRFTRLQHAEVDDEARASFNLVAIVEELITAHESEVEGKLATISLETTQTAAFVQGLSSEIISAVSEVIANAVQYTAIGGHIGVVLRSNSEKIALRVSNISADSDTSEKFNSASIFKNGPNGLDGSSSGLGLGLSLVKLIARRNEFIFDLRNGSDARSVATFIFDNADPTSNLEAVRLAS